MNHTNKFIRSSMLVLAMTLGAGAAQAQSDEGQGSQVGANNNGASFALAATLGERVYFLDGGVYRGQASIELVPSFGWAWFKFDLGLSSTLESIQIEKTNIGYWNFTFRPGARLTPPILPLYARIGFPLQIQRDDLDYGVMLGAGTDISLMAGLSLVIEVDTTLSKDLKWGGDGVPLEFRAGVSFSF